MKNLSLIFYFIVMIPFAALAHLHKAEHIHHSNGSVTWLDSIGLDLKYVPRLSCSGKDARGNLVTGSLQQYFINGNAHTSHLWSLQNQNEKWIIYTEFGVVGPFRSMKIIYTSTNSKDINGKPHPENGNTDVNVSQSGNQFRITGKASYWQSGRASTYDFRVRCLQIKN